MATNKQALVDAVLMFGDLVKDIEASQKASGPMKLLAFQSLIPDFMKLLPEIGDIPSEAKQMAYQDYMDLAQQLVARLAIDDKKAQAIISAAIKLANDIALIVIPDVNALIEASKS